MVIVFKQFLLFLRANLVHLRQGYGVHGQLSEWLGIGLQNRLRRFESATDLNKIPEARSARGFFVLSRSRLAGLREENKKDLDCRRQQGFC
jgi:hypothetical protein